MSFNFIGKETISADGDSDEEMAAKAGESMFSDEAAGTFLDENFQDNPFNQNLESEDDK
jgi:hypothetical protein